jgi:diguanylate cyclase (GGDEF)-like protein
LTTVKQVHDLSPEQAGRHIPVRLRGVMTGFSGWRDYFFFQDATGGTAINREEHGVVNAGDEIEIDGVSDPGLFSNSVISKRVRVIGPGRLPDVPVSTYSDLEGGVRDAEWIKVRGVVQSAKLETIWEKSVLVLGLEIAGTQMAVRVFHFDAADLNRLVDAKILVGGVCGTAYNDKRQFTGLRLFVGDAQSIVVEEPAPDDPYAGPPHPIRSVMQVGPRDRARHRVKIAGVVTYQDRGHSLYVQDGADGILVATEQDEAVPAGTRIEALGFPALGNYSPEITNAVFRVVSRGNSVEPAAIRAGDFLQYKDTFAYAPYDSQLVRLTGKVVSPLALPNEDAWLLRDGEGDFVASLRHGAGGPRLPPVANGATVSVVGVMEVVADSERRPESFRVLLRGPADLEIVAQAPWWTPMRSLVVLGLLLIATLGAVLWTMMLRRQVHRQTALLRESEGRFRTQAQIDTLTGVASRAFLHEQLDAAIGSANRIGGLIGVLMLDLDHFKQVNDTLGHHVGDALLCIVAHRIRATVRKTDVVARMGGDEFVVLLMDLGNAAEAETIGAKLVANVAVPAEIEGREMAVSASVGVCVYPSGGADGDTLLQHCDEAMYQAKKKGRNSSCMYAAAETRRVGAAGVLG